MSGRTGQRPVPGPPEPEIPRPEGLRERKKRLMRQQLSDTATKMFLARGFDAVRVSEVAEACGVSEKTVFNYFPTKESLVLDRFDATMAALRSGLADPSVTPVEAALRILADELRGQTSWLAGQDDQATAVAQFQRFGTLIRATPSLQVHLSSVTARLIAVATEVLATRAGLGRDAPEPQIAATALLGLWQVQANCLRKHLDGSRTPAQVQEAVTADVRRAAKLIDAGLGSTGLFDPADPAVPGAADRADR
jgi:AcrR family transcriptional regulator